VVVARKTESGGRAGGVSTAAREESRLGAACN